MAEIVRRNLPDGESLDNGILARAVRLLDIGANGPVATMDELESRYRTDLDDVTPTPEISEEVSVLVANILGGSDIPPVDLAVGKAAVEYINAFTRRRDLIIQWAWERDGLLGMDSFYRPLEEPSHELLVWFGAIAVTDIEDTSFAKTIAARPLRPIISPAFRHDGREGLGRISSDEVTFSLYDALIAPKEEWTETAKGWPIFRPTPGSDRISIRVTPIVENRNNLDTQRAEMWNIVSELGVRDFDVIAIMMAQVLAEGRPDGRAILPADTVLDYRGVGQRLDEDGYSEGRQPKLRSSIAESVYRIAHLRITTDGLPILEYDRKGKPNLSTIDFNEPVVELHSNYSRRRDDKTLLWEYSLGRWFTTYRQKPHAYTAYMLQRALGYNPKTQQWAKQLAYYLALELRRNADNGQELTRPISWFIDGARIPCEQRYAQKVRDRVEDGMRQIMRDGLIRIVRGDTIIDKSSPGVDTWTPEGVTTLKGRDWLGAYRKLTVSIRCDEDTEQRYDREIRKRAALAKERKENRAAGRKGRAS